MWQAGKYGSTLFRRSPWDQDRAYDLNKGKKMAEGAQGRWADNDLEHLRP